MQIWQVAKELVILSHAQTSIFLCEPTCRHKGKTEVPIPFEK